MDDLKAFRSLTKNLIPVQLVGMNEKGEEVVIGDFHSGVVLNGMSVQDVASNEIIASMSMKSRHWIVKGTPCRYLFIQVKPID